MKFFRSVEIFGCHINNFISINHFFHFTFFFKTTDNGFIHDYTLLLSPRLQKNKKKKHSYHWDEPLLQVVTERAHHQKGPLQGHHIGGNDPTSRQMIKHLGQSQASVTQRLTPFARLTYGPGNSTYGKREVRTVSTGVQLMSHPRVHKKTPQDYHPHPPSTSHENLTDHPRCGCVPQCGKFVYGSLYTPGDKSKA